MFSKKLIFLCLLIVSISCLPFHEFFGICIDKSQCKRNMQCSSQLGHCSFCELDFLGGRKNYPQTIACFVDCFKTQLGENISQQAIEFIICLTDGSKKKGFTRSEVIRQIMDNEKDEYKMEETYNNNLDFIWEPQWSVFRHYHQPTHKHQIISLVDFLKPLTGNYEVFYNELNTQVPSSILPFFILKADSDSTHLSQFLNQFPKEQAWIKKSVKPDQGVQTQIFTSSENLLNRAPFSQDVVIQPYLQEPLLIDNKKFALKNFVLVASTEPWFVLYHPGYLKLSLQNYDKNFEDNLDKHLVQNKNQDLRAPEISPEITHSIKKTLASAYQKVSQSIRQKSGRFEIFENEFIIDANTKQPYFLKIAREPLSNLDEEIGTIKIPDILQILNLALSVNEQTAHDLRNMLRNPTQYFELGEWQILINEADNFNYAHSN